MQGEITAQNLQENSVNVVMKIPHELVDEIITNPPNFYLIRNEKHGNWSL